MAIALCLCYASHPDDTETNTFLARLREVLIADYLGLREIEYTIGKSPKTKIAEFGPNHVIFVISNRAFAHKDCLIDLEYASEESNGVNLIPISWKGISLAETEEFYTQSISTGWEDYKTRLITLQEKISALNWVGFDQYLKAEKTDSEGVFARQFRRLTEAIQDQTSTYHFMISYNRMNTSFTKAIKQALESPNNLSQTRYDVWFDADDIRPAEPWLKAIFRGIEASDTVLLFVSNSWLGSYNCHVEYEHALKMGKYIIPIEIQETNPVDSKAQTDWYLPNVEQGYRYMLTREGWENQTDSSKLELIIKKLAKLRKFYDPIKVSQTLTASIYQSSDSTFTNNQREFEDLIDRIRDRHEKLAHLTSKHTRLLIRAQKRPKERDLLTRKELASVRQWVRESDKRKNQPPQVVDIQLDFIRLSSTQLWWQNAAVTAVVSIILLVMLGIFLAGQSALSNQALEAQRAINLEIDRSLQTLAQLNRQTEYPVGQKPDELLQVGDSVWVTDETDGSLNRLPINGDTPPAALELSGGLKNLQYYQGYVWVYGQTEALLYRVDTMTNTVESIKLPAAAHTIIGAGERIWVLSNVDHVLYQINATVAPLNIEREIPIGQDDVSLVAGGRYVWLHNKNQGILTRFDANSAEQQVYNGFLNSTKFLYQAGDLWFIRDQFLIRIDFESGQVGAISEVLVAVDVDISVDAGDVYAVSADKTTLLHFDRETLHVQSQYQVTSEIRRWYNTPDHLWIFTATSEAFIFDKAQKTLVTTQLIQGNQEPSIPLSDGTNLWITPNKQGTSYVFDSTDGTLYRQFQLCSEVSTPVFDGAQMWFGCPTQQRVISLPAHLAFFGERTSLEDERQHQPILIDRWLWMIQEQTGRLLIYDTVQDQLVSEVILTPGLVPLVEDGEYLWTGVASTGQVIRISPNEFSLNAPQETYIQTVDLGRSFATIDVFERYIWLRHNDPRPGIKLSVIDRDAVSITRRVQDSELGIGIWGAITYNNEVWAVGATGSAGFLIRMTASGEILEEIDIPDTLYSAWNIIPIGDTLWLNVVVPRADEVITVLFGLMGDSEALREMQEGGLFSVRGYIPSTQTWRSEQWRVPTTVSNPIEDDVWIWFSILGTPPAFTDAEVGSESGEIALNITTGEVVSFIDRCNQTTNTGEIRYGMSSAPMRHGDFIYAGCYDESNEFVVYDIKTKMLHRIYDDLGRRPRPSIHAEGQVWVVFEATNTLAVFDEATGELISQLSVDEGPSIPLIQDGFAWIYHSLSDTLQRITIVSR